MCNYLNFCVSIVCVCLDMSLSLYLSRCVFMSQSLYVSICICLIVCLYLFISDCVSLSVYVYICISVSTVYVFLSVLVCVSLYLCGRVVCGCGCVCVCVCVSPYLAELEDSVEDRGNLLPRETLGQASLYNSITASTE